MDPAKLIILGNCVGEKLALLLEGLVQRQQYFCPGLSRQWHVIRIPPIFHIPQKDWADVAAKAAGCDLVFTQPIFNFGPCNTSTLRAQLGEKLRVFSAPNFEAYFPDAISIGRQNEKFAPPLEWHSRIFVMGKLAGLSCRECAEIYAHHPIFNKAATAALLQKSWENYRLRETGVEIGTLAEALAHYAAEPLFYSFNHPADRLLKKLLSGMLSAMGLDDEGVAKALRHIPWTKDPIHGWTEWGFGFNAWPVITGRQSPFKFESRNYFRIAGKTFSIEDAAAGFYYYYDAHPEIFNKLVAIVEKS